MNQMLARQMLFASKTNLDLCAVVFFQLGLRSHLCNPISRWFTLFFCGVLDVDVGLVQAHVFLWWLLIQTSTSIELVGFQEKLVEIEVEALEVAETLEISSFRRSGCFVSLRLIVSVEVVRLKDEPWCTRYVLRDNTQLVSGRGGTLFGGSAFELQVAVNELRHYEFCHREFSEDDVVWWRHLMQLSPRFKDVSDVREVPNNQEVFQDPNRDESLIIELLERKENVADAGSARWFLEDLAVEQASENSLVVQEESSVPATHIPNLDETTTVNAVTGTMSITKGRQGPEAANLVRVYLANIRLRRVETDILVTIYEPLSISAQSESAAAVGAGATVPAPAAGCMAAADVFKQVLSTFLILDWSLFGYIDDGDEAMVQ